MSASRLADIVQAHVDEVGVREAAIARKMGVSSQLLSTWRRHGIASMPRPETLEALAKVTRTPYEEVLLAALADTEYLRGEQRMRDHLSGVGA